MIYKNRDPLSIFNGDDISVEWDDELIDLWQFDIAGSTHVAVSISSRADAEKLIEVLTQLKEKAFK